MKVKILNIKLISGSFQNNKIKLNEDKIIVKFSINGYIYYFSTFLNEKKFFKYKYKNTDKLKKELDDYIINIMKTISKQNKDKEKIEELKEKIRLTYQIEEEVY